MSPSLQQLTDLKGKVAVVTGAARGIGQAISTRLAEAGASVVLSDIDAEAVTAAAEAIRATGGTVASLKTDASLPADADRLIAFAVEQFGGVDILVNNAGVFPFAPVAQVTEALWDKVMNLNLKGAFFHAQAAAKRMLEQRRGGKIINLASVEALQPIGFLVHYASSKAGVVAMTKAMALELGPFGIHVNALAPGGIETPGMKSSTESFLSLLGVSPEVADKQRGKYAARLPLRRAGQPDEVARAALFLASPMSDFVTGSLMVVDGGHLLGKFPM